VTRTSRTALRGDILRRLRQTSGRGRKLRQMSVLLRPYRSRVIWMLVSLLAATAAALAPAPLAKFAIDDGIKQGDLRTLNLVVLALSAGSVSVRCRTCACGSSSTCSPSRSASTSAARRER